MDDETPKIFKFVKFQVRKLKRSNRLPDRGHRRVIEQSGILTVRKSAPVLSPDRAVTKSGSFSGCTRWITSLARSYFMSQKESHHGYVCLS
jgi:hypothetical protein